MRATRRLRRPDRAAAPRRARLRRAPPPRRPLRSPLARRVPRSARRRPRPAAGRRQGAAVETASRRARRPRARPAPAAAPGTGRPALRRRRRRGRARPRGARQAPDLRLALEHLHGEPGGAEQVGEQRADRPAADDGDVDHAPGVRPRRAARRIRAATPRPAGSPAARAPALRPISTTRHRKAKDRAARAAAGRRTRACR